MALQGTTGDVKELQKELLNRLMALLLGEKFSDDVIADTEVIGRNNTKITTAILKKIARVPRSIQSNDERLTRLINEFLPRFEALGQ